MSRLGLWLGVAVVLGICAIGAWMLGSGTSRAPDTAPNPDLPTPASPDGVARMQLFEELQPVRLANCTLERFGETHDGGYLMCANLLGAVASGYSYGISGYDQWGCDISGRFGVSVHQYDCFDLTRPACPNGNTLFHQECIAGETRTDVEGRTFDTLENQLARNGDDGTYLVVKMDVEGAEWDSLLQTPAAVLERIDQLAIELHGIDADPGKYMATMRLLKQFFYVAHLHFNNYSCVDDMPPFPAYAYEVLFVSKRVGILDPDQAAIRRPHPLDGPNNPKEPDCQGAGHGNLSGSVDSTAMGADNGGT